MTHAHESRNFFLNGPAGKLEASLWTPANAPASFAALVCHPHPLFGGTMHNKVVYNAAKALDRLGFAVLRFNFRGAGQSEGTHDKGLGERDDVRCALDFLKAEFPSASLLLAGFSFGCWVGLRAGCQEPRVQRLIAMGAPVDNSDFTYLQSCAKPKLFVHGGNDQFGSVPHLLELVAALPGDNRIVVVENVDHFFTGKIEQLGLAITGWIQQQS
jgi:alpha/beta superfamily hydrolase